MFSIGTRNVASLSESINRPRRLPLISQPRPLLCPSSKKPPSFTSYSCNRRFNPSLFFFFLVFSFSSHFLNSRLLSRPRLLPCPSSSIHFLPRPRSINDPVNRPLCRRLPYDPASKASQGWPFFWFPSLSNWRSNFQKVIFSFSSNRRSASSSNRRSVFRRTDAAASKWSSFRLRLTVDPASSMPSSFFWSAHSETLYFILGLSTLTLG